jgi:hypothetical protein
MPSPWPVRGPALASKVLLVLDIRIEEKRRRFRGMMSYGTAVGPEETAAIQSSIRRLESRGVDRRRALRRVAASTGTTVRYVRQRVYAAEQELA